MPDRLQENRYCKQILLEEIGEEGQKRLLNSSVVVAGCGGLGSMISNCLVRAGVGSVTIVDRDFVELDNLQRQILFDEEDVKRGSPKSLAAAEKLRRINSEVRIEPIVAEISPENIEDLIKGTDLVFDGTDNFETRFLINDACLKLGVPWIYGGIMETRGLCFAIIPGETPCFRCIVPELPTPGDFPYCGTFGILGTAVSIVASLEVTEGIKLLVKRNDALLGGLINIDVWTGSCELVKIRNGLTKCPACGQKRFEFLQRGKRNKPAG